MVAQAVRYAKFNYQGLIIYGEVWSLDELLRREKELGADEFEQQWQRQHFTQVYKRGYVYGKWASVVEVEGEYGSNPEKALTFISKDVYETARRDGWKA